MKAWKEMALACSVATLGACDSAGHPEIAPIVEAASAAGIDYIVRDSTIHDVHEASAVAEPYAQATVSTKLMGTVLAVYVKEGDQVSLGQPLLRIDARDLDAKRQQVQAGIAASEALQHEAELMATRMRALYADSAAPKSQLDAAESGLARANAGVASARAGVAEIDAVAGYAVVRAPFPGVVTQRFVDVGAFAAPGGPLLTVQDQARLRVVATVAPNVARLVKRGARVTVLVEGIAATASVEGVVPTTGGSLYLVNAVVDNRHGALVSGGAAQLLIEDGLRQAILVPKGAIRREGGLVGVVIRSGASMTTRWIRLGRTVGAAVEVLAGVGVGDTIRVPNASSGT